MEKVTIVDVLDKVLDIARKTFGKGTVAVNVGEGYVSATIFKCEEGKVFCFYTWQDDYDVSAEYARMMDYYGEEC